VAKARVYLGIGAFVAAVVGNPSPVPPFVASLARAGRWRRIGVCSPRLIVSR
jgi:hypothetical protein